MRLQVLADAHVVPGQRGRAGGVAAAVEGHFLDEAHVNGQVAAEVGQRNKVVDVLPVHHHGVDFHLNAGFQQRVQAFPAPRGSSSRRVMLENRSRSSVSRLRLTAFTPRRARAGTCGAVSTPLVVRLMSSIPGSCGQALHEGHQVAPHKRLAAGQAHFAHAQAGQQAGQAQHFLVAQQLVLGHVLDAFFGHAVEAAQVAAVRHGQAQVFQRPAVLVVEA